jgi:hypothetical protein
MGLRSPGIPERTTLVGPTSARAAAMSEDFRKISREKLDRANEISEVAIFWGLILTVVVIVIAVLKGLFG